MSTSLSSQRSDDESTSAPSPTKTQGKGKVIKRHADFYSSGLITVQIGDTLYRVDIRILNYFQVFRDMFQHASGFNPEKDEGQVDENPILLEGVTAFQFESLLKLSDLSSILDNDTRTYEFWDAILHISSIWDSEELRQHAIREIDNLKPSAAKYIYLAQKYNVSKWIEPAFVELCRRPESLSADEISMIGLPLLVHLCMVRERRAAITCSSHRAACGHLHCVSYCKGGNFLQYDGNGRANALLEEVCNKLRENDWK
ncbi:hypothetical protein FRC03_003850 [Tulasnella sp. 419]|nr:hypothetical protein FRC03_003850 [Tulasnella sp. 419]